MSETNQGYKSVWFTVPARILNLPDLTLAYLKIYETIFQFWNHGKACFLSNKMIMTRTSIDSDNTIRNAFRYFEKHKELMRVNKDGKRYLIQPQTLIETEGLEIVDNSVGGGDASPGGGLQLAGGGGDASPHKINNINNKNLNKSSCFKSGTKANNSVDNSKKHDWATPKPPTFSDPTKQSTSYKHEEYEKPSQEAIDAAMLKLPRHMRPKRFRANDTTELPSGTTLQPEVPERPHPSPESLDPATDREKDFSPPVRGADRVMAPSSARSYLEKVGMAGA